jgi:hypothetical protein
LPLLSYSRKLPKITFRIFLLTVRELTIDYLHNFSQELELSLAGTEEPFLRVYRESGGQVATEERKRIKATSAVCCEAGSARRET